MLSSLQCISLATDLNECYLGTYECHFSQVCSNTPGSYECSCNPGQVYKDGQCQGRCNENELACENVMCFMIYYCMVWHGKWRGIPCYVWYVGFGLALAMVALRQSFSEILKFTDVRNLAYYYNHSLTSQIPSSSNYFFCFVAYKLCITVWIEDVTWFIPVDKDNVI